MSRPAATTPAELAALLGMAAHALRSPLAAIQNWIYLLQAENALSSLGRRATDGILAGIREQLELIEQLANLRASCEGSATVELQPQQVEARIAAAMQDIEPAADRQGAALERYATAVDCVVQTDPERFQRLLALLLARRLRAGGRVQLGTTVDRGRLCLHIGDLREGMRQPLPPGDADAPADFGWLVACRLADQLGARLQGRRRGETMDYRIEMPPAPPQTSASRTGAGTAGAGQDHR
jgi:K+-sensing histidine kinase KdpD